MSIQATYGGDLPKDVVVCVGGGLSLPVPDETPLPYPSMINVTFPGVPPFIVNQANKHINGSQCYGGIFSLNTTTYSFDTRDFIGWTGWKQGDYVVTLTAQQLKPGSNHSYPYFYSPSFLITNANATTTSTVGSGTSSRSASTTSTAITSTTSKASAQHTVAGIENHHLSLQSLMICTMLMLPLMISAY